MERMASGIVPSNQSPSVRALILEL
jgi:hypothetical protein